MATGIAHDPAAAADGSADRPALGMPALRIGEILARSRNDNGESLVDVADRIEWRFTPIVLRMIEAGAYPLTPGDVATLLRGYRVQLGDLRPARDHLRVEEGAMSSGGNRRRIRSQPDAGRLLHDYVRFVREMRGLAPGGRVAMESLRTEDVEVLAETLRTGVEVVETGIRSIVEPRSLTRDDHVRLAGLYGVDTDTVERFVNGLLDGRT